MTSLIPAFISVALTQVLFGMVCFAWGYLKGRNYETIEILFSKGKKTK